jgi:plasmid stabilization system protein ParE
MQRWDVPLLENVLLAPRSRVGTFSRVAILGERVTEKCVEATKQAVETPGGGRNRPRITNAARYRRAASRSGGAASAERDGRPVSTEKRTQGRRCRGRFSATRVAEPGAAENVARRVGPQRDRRSPGTAATGPGRTAPQLRPFSCSPEHESYVPCSAREGTQRWDVPLLENVLLAPRSRVGTFSRVAILGRRVTEKCVEATKQAVETPGGGRNRPRITNAARHRRAASRSGGVASAERDGRPVSRRTVPRGAAAEGGSPQRAWRS